MAESKIIGHGILTDYNSGTVANTTLKTIGSLTLGTGKWLVYSLLTFNSGVSGNTQAQNRLKVNGSTRSIKWNADTSLWSPVNMEVSNGNETVELQTYVQNGSSSNGYTYILKAIKIA